MSKAFTKATGIPVSLDDNSTRAAADQIEALQEQPEWGLLWVDARPRSLALTPRACC